MSSITPTDLKLYQKDGACSFVPHCLLEYIGIPYTPMRLVVGPNGYVPESGMTREEYIQKIHPSGYVPAMTFADDKGEDILLNENPAIISFISNLSPERQLLGTTALDRARVAEWLSWLSGTFHAGAVAMVYRPERFTDSPDNGFKDTIREKGRAIAVKSLDRIEQRVGATEAGFAVGATLTVVDFYLSWFWHMAEVFNFDPAAKYPKFRKVVQRVNGLDAVKRVMEAENLTMGA